MTLFNSLLTFVGLFCFGCSAEAQLIVAHRGASGDAPENSLAAFRLAWEQQADAIEADFYLTSDNQIVCIHDSTTKRTAPGQPELTVAQSTLAQLKQLDVGSWKDVRFRGESVPTLDEVLALVPEGKMIFIEIKCGVEIVDHLEECLSKCHLSNQQIMIISFNEQVIQQVRRAMPQYKANWLVGYKQDDPSAPWKPTPTEVLSKFQRSGASGIGTNANRNVVDNDFVSQLSASGGEFHVWTVNNVEDARHFAQLGALSITTDLPGRIGSSLRAESTP